MSKRTITEKIQEMKERNNIRRSKRMDTNARHEHIRKQMETYKEKTRMLQQMMNSQEALARELKQMEQEMEAQRREAEAEVVSHKEPGKAEQPAADTRKLEQQVEQLAANVSAIQDKEQQICAAMEELGGRLDELRHELNSGLLDLRKELPGEPSEGSGDVSGRLDEIKEELAEKIHTESVKCYRNVQSLVEESRDEIKEACAETDGASKLRGPVTGAIVLGAVNLVFLVVLGLLELGVFDFLM